MNNIHNGIDGLDYDDMFESNDGLPTVRDYIKFDKESLQFVKDHYVKYTDARIAELLSKRLGRTVHPYNISYIRKKLGLKKKNLDFTDQDGIYNTNEQIIEALAEVDDEEEKEKELEFRRNLDMMGGK